MPVIPVLAVSILLQFLGAFFAFRLIKATGKTYSWILISAALFFMGARQLIPLFHLIFTHGSYTPDLISEIAALFVSLLMFIGVMKIRRFFTERGQSTEKNQVIKREEAPGYPAGRSAGEASVSPVTDGKGGCNHPAGSVHDITKYERMIEELAVSETRYRRLFESAKDGILILDAETGIITDVNPFLIELLGYSYEQFVEKKIWEIGFFKDIIANKDKFMELQQKEYVRYEDMPLETTDGRKIDVEFVSNVYSENHHKVIQCNIRDITERKRAEDELKFRNLLLTTQQETALDGILIINESGKIISRNKRFLIMWGITFEETETRSIGDILRSTLHLLADPDQYSKKVHYLFAHTNETSHDEISFMDGRCFAVYSAPMTGPDNKYYGRVWYFHDITSMKKSEEELKNYHDRLEELVKKRTNELAGNRNMLRTLIDSLPDEIYAKDIESRFIMANFRVLNNFRLSRFEDILGKTDFILLPREEAMKSYTKEHSVLRHGGQMINYEEPVTGADGKTHWLAVTKAPMRDGEGNITGLVGINRDITYLKESEEALKKAKEAAEAANVAKSAFLSNMSHEIRTPLNAILGFSELMQNDDKLAKEHIEWLGTINRSGEHLLALINDILEVSRIESGRITFNPSNFDLRALLRDIEEMFKIKTGKKNLALLFEYSDELPKYVVTDEGKLRQIIINLVGNAVKFTKKGGIALRARTDRENDKTRLVMEIEDTGPGIAGKDIDKLFLKFGQTEAGISEGGTGLGLVISQEYAKSMNGNIIVKSEEGKGTCFTLAIDIGNGEEFVKKENQKKQVIGLKPGQKSFRILVADDRETNRAFLKILLASAGFQVEEAGDGNETIAKFRVWLPDLILMDMRMPVMNGYETIRNIREIEEKKTQIIAVTAGAFREDRQKAREAGAAGTVVCQ